MLSLEALFCCVDDFCRTFEPNWRQKLLTDGRKRRNRKRKLCLSDTKSRNTCTL
jgi:hypothetical protein